MFSDASVLLFMREGVRVHQVLPGERGGYPDHVTYLPVLAKMGGGGHV